MKIGDNNLKMCFFKILTIGNSKYIQLLKFPRMFGPWLLIVFFSFRQKMTSWKHYEQAKLKRVFRRELAKGRFQTIVPSSGILAVAGKCLLGILPSLKRIDSMTDYFWH